MGGRLVIIGGHPGVGKTTLAHRLEKELDLPAFCKDEIKERMFDRLGWSDTEWSRKLSLAAYAAMDLAMDSILARQGGLIVESNFIRKYDSERIAAAIARYQADAAQVVLHCDKTVRHRRFQERNGSARHPGHHALDGGQLDLKASYEPLDLPCPLIEMDVTDFPAADFDGLPRRIAAALAG